MLRLHAVLDLPAPHHEPLVAFWQQAIGWPAGEPWRGHPELRSLEPPEGGAYVHVQAVEGPARVHVDLETPDPGATLAAARELGAELVAEHERWTTLTSPGGLPFCVVRAPLADARTPGPVEWSDGHRTRLVQVCVDSPADVHDREVAFWRDLLGGRWAASPAPEFAGKWHDDDGGPLQLLFQRLDETTGPVRAHLDLGTDDLAAEVRRLVALGADDGGAGGGWHVLRDPGGLAFCATVNSPEATLRRELT